MAGAQPASLSCCPSSAVVMVDNAQNWLRINLIVDLCLIDVLLTVIHNRKNDLTYAGLPEDGVDLYNRMQAFKSKSGNQLKKVIREEQWNVICPSSGVSNSSKWDVTTLKIVAQYVVLDSKPPMAGWENDPIPIDHSLAAVVCRVKNIRNYVKHCTIKAFTDATVCNNTLAKILNILQRFGYSNMKLFYDLARGSLKLYSDAIMKVLQQKINDTSDQVKILEDANCETNKELKSLDQNIEDSQIKIECLQQDVKYIKTCIHNITSVVDNHHVAMQQQLLQHTDDLYEKLFKSIMAKVEALQARLAATEKAVRFYQKGNFAPINKCFIQCVSKNFGLPKHIRET